ncbi:MAG: hypothetical protein ACK559_26745, partial [bacterium]
MGGHAAARHDRRRRTDLQGPASGRSEPPARGVAGRHRGAAPRGRHRRGLLRPRRGAHTGPCP